jgi:hypothetical protein
MGMFWDLIQQNELDDQKVKADTLEVRVSQLENDLFKTKALLIKTLKVLEEQSGKDIDGDGKLG